MKVVGSTTRHEIDPHGSRSHSLVQIRLTCLDGHFLEVFQTRFEPRLCVTREFHSARRRHDAVNAVPLSDHRKAVPGSVSRCPGEARCEECQRADVSALYGQVLNLLDIERRGDCIRARFHERAIGLADDHFLDGNANLQRDFHIRDAASLNFYSVQNFGLKSVLSNR